MSVPKLGSCHFSNWFSRGWMLNAHLEPWGFLQLLISLRLSCKVSSPMWPIKVSIPTRLLTSLTIWILKYVASQRILMRKKNCQTLKKMQELKKKRKKGTFYISRLNKSIKKKNAKLPARYWESFMIPESGWWSSFVNIPATENKGNIRKLLKIENEWLSSLKIQEIISYHR